MSYGEWAESLSADVKHSNAQPAPGIGREDRVHTGPNILTTGYCAETRPPAVYEMEGSTPICFERINPTDRVGAARWDRLVCADKEATLFHSSAWARVLTDTYGYIPNYAIVLGIRGNDILLPCMEVGSALAGRRGVSLPFTDFCEPLGEVPQDAPRVFAALLDCARSRKWRSIELRRNIGVDSCASESYYRHRLSLVPETDVLLANCAGVIRTNIKKALKEGLRIEISQSLAFMKEYYRLHCLTRKRHGIPPQPIALFENIHRHVIDKEMGFIVLAFLRSQAIAGSVYLGLGTNAMYKYGGSDYRYQHLRANSLVMWEAICHLRQRGYTNLCLGRTDLDADGLRRFKSHWGAIEDYVSYRTYNMRSGAFESASRSDHLLARRILRHTPVPILRMLGTAIYRYCG